MRPNYDEQGYVKWSDVGQLWRDMEREYGVHITMAGRWAYTKRRDLGIYLSVQAHTTGREPVNQPLCSAGFIYPDTAHRTVPGASVGAIYRICDTLERQRREQAQLVQAAFVPPDA